MIDTTLLPPRDEMVRAFMGRDQSYDGLFITAVATTGIFCRPSCGARKPLPEHVEFYSTARDALLAGFRPCKRCRPMEAGGTAPSWLRELFEDIETEPARRWTDADLRRRGLQPERVRRWFQKHHGMTFHAYHRARRLGLALGRLRHDRDVTSSAFDHGFESLSGFNDAFRRLFGTSPGKSGSSTVVVLNRLPTPLGPMVIGSTDEAICLLEFADRRMLGTQLQRLCARLECTLVPGSNAVTERAAAEIGGYFEGEHRHFSVPFIAPGTDFQKRVWELLLDIPYGSTVSYAELGRRLGRVKAVRAVGRAVGDNRLAILIPCHRVVGADGRLTGYGGGLWRKQRLLDLERQRAVD